jgi:hypothetical protein
MTIAELSATALFLVALLGLILAKGISLKAKGLMICLVALADVWLHADLPTRTLSVLGCSGPLLPMLLPLLLRRASQERFRWNLCLFVLLTSIQALSLAPFARAELRGDPEPGYYLFLPFYLGILMFLTTASYAIGECRRLQGMMRWPAITSMPQAPTTSRCSTSRPIRPSPGVSLSHLCFCSTGHDAKSGPPDARPGNGRGVEVFDLSDPAQPTKLGVFNFPRFLPRDNAPPGRTGDSAALLAAPAFQPSSAIVHRTERESVDDDAGQLRLTTVQARPGFASFSRLGASH